MRPVYCTNFSETACNLKNIYYDHSHYEENYLLNNSCTVNSIYVLL